MVLESMGVHVRNILVGILGQTLKERMTVAVEVPIVICEWYLKYSVHMLDITDVIIDVAELCLKLK